MDENIREEILQENKMGTMPVGRLLFSMAVPMMVSMLFQALYNVVDSIFVAKLSQDAMNAVSLAFPLQTLCIAFSGGTGVGMNALLSRSLGEKNQAGADRAANVGLFLTLCNFALFALIGWTLAGPFFRFQTDNPQIIAYGRGYVTVCIGCSIGLFFQMYNERLLQSTGRTNLSMITQIAGAATNIVLDPILIFGLLGFPRLEVAGCGDRHRYRSARRARPSASISTSRAIPTCICAAARSVPTPRRSRRSTRSACRPSSCSPSAR